MDTDAQEPTGNSITADGSALPTTADVEPPPAASADDVGDGGGNPPAFELPPSDPIPSTPPDLHDFSDLADEDPHPHIDPAHPIITPTVHTDAPALTPDAVASPDGQFLVRDAGLNDLTFIDSLQKTHGWQVGFLPKTWLIKSLTKHLVTLLLENGQPAAYLLGKATYMRRVDVGIIHQACVQYDAQRRTIGTALVEHHLARFPATTALVGLWCAQDLDANLFWSAMHFRPVAYRAGSRQKGRVHIYWQRLLQPHAPTRLWIPEQTGGGPMKEIRQVTPLTAADDWKAPKTIILPDPTDAVARRMGRKGQPIVDRRAIAELEAQRAAFRGSSGSGPQWWLAGRKQPLDLAKVRAHQGSMPGETPQQ